MNKEILNIGLTTALLIAIPACARQRPSLHSNEHLMRVGSSVAERDIDLCIQQVEVAREGQENLAENAAVSTAGSAAIGAAAGGAGGAVVGQAGQGAAIGAASSAAASLMYSLLGAFSDPISQPRLTRDSLTGAFAKKATSRSGSSAYGGRSL